MSTGSETTVHRVTKISLLPIQEFKEDEDSNAFYVRSIIATTDGGEFVFKLFSPDKDTLKIGL